VESVKSVAFCVFFSSGIDFPQGEPYLDDMTIERWLLISAAFLTAVFLPALLLPLVLTYILIIDREFLSIVPVAAPKYTGTQNYIALKPRSPPAL
jgi:hypothetical protein